MGGWRGRGNLAGGDSGTRTHSAGAPPNSLLEVYPAHDLAVDHVVQGQSGSVSTGERFERRLDRRPETWRPCLVCDGRIGDSRLGLSRLGSL